MDAVDLRASTSRSPKAPVGDPPSTTPGPTPKRVPGLAAEVCRWPRDAHRRAAFIAQQRPCIWLLEAGELVPELGPLEDWVRLPADAGVLEERVERLEARTRCRGGLLPGEVLVDGDGLCTWNGRWVAVPPVEALILDRLGATPECVVGRSELEAVVWSGATRSRRAIDSRVHALRSRIAPLGLQVHTIRAQGFLLAAEPPSPSPSRGASPPVPRRTPWSS